MTKENSEETTMNPMLNDYERNYVEAHNSANEVIKQLNKFYEHYSKLADSDKNRLFQQVITEQVATKIPQPVLNYLFKGTLY